MLGIGATEFFSFNHEKQLIEDMTELCNDYDRFHDSCKQIESTYNCSGWRTAPENENVSDLTACSDAVAADYAKLKICFLGNVVLVGIESLALVYVICNQLCSRRPAKVANDFDFACSPS
jgi:hypothetical protein